MLPNFVKPCWTAALLVVAYILIQGFSFKTTGGIRAMVTVLQKNHHPWTYAEKAGALSLKCQYENKCQFYSTSPSILIRGRHFVRTVKGFNEQLVHTYDQLGSPEVMDVNVVVFGNARIDL
jgi:hypothetical protein